MDGVRGAIMWFNTLVRISVGTDVSRPRAKSTANEDVIHRSLQTTYPQYFIKQHYRVLLARQLLTRTRYIGPYS